MMFFCITIRDISHDNVDHTPHMPISIGMCGTEVKSLVV